LEHMKAKRLLFPTYPNQYGTIAIIPTDWTGALIAGLSGYSTNAMQVFRTRQVYSVGPLVQIANAINNGTITFVATSAQNFANLATVFDQYRIRVASVSFTPQITVSSLVAGLGSTITNPRIYTCIDLDDTGAVTQATIQQYDSCVITPPCNGVCRALRPHIAVAAYSGTFTSYMNVVDQWIDVASSGVIHYGVKYVVEPAMTGQTVLQAYDVDVTLFMEFRSTR
jgi:hypothetical protein